MSRAVREAQAERARYVREQEGIERRSILRGLILLAAVVLTASLIHAGADRAFPAGWMHRW